ncbi:hypothetical protein V7S79_03045 [Aquirufa sp. ROCK-SH2]
MEFKEYLTSKKIDALSFEQNDEQLFLVWKKEFELMHASSFTDQKKFQINRIRRKYQLINPL